MKPTSLKCLEITIVFSDRSRNGQHITLGDGPTGAHTLAVSDSGDRLVVEFIDLQGGTRQLMAWPMTQVHSYTLGNVQTTPLLPTVTVYEY